MPSLLQIQKICFHSLSQACALLVATSLLVTALSAGEPARQSRVRIQAVKPPSSAAEVDTIGQVTRVSANAPAAKNPIVKAASLAVFLPAAEPALTPPPSPEVVPSVPPADVSGGEPLSPSDQLNLQRNVIDDRGRLSRKDEQYFENLSPQDREMLYEGKQPGQFGIGRTYRYEIDGEPVAPPENIAQKVFSQEPLEGFPYGYQRDWYPTVAMWEAPSFYHRPLYFEEVNLERYGHRHTHLQPVASTAHFFANTLALPYKIGVNHPCERIYTLGHYRPGDCNPHARHGLPWSWRGAAYTGAVYTGVAFIP